MQIIVVGNNDGHAFLRRGFRERLEATGGFGVAIGDESFCQGFDWRGSRGVSLPRVVDASDPEAYRDALVSTIRYGLDAVALQSPPEDPDTLEWLRRLIHTSGTISTLAIAIPSPATEEFFEATSRLLAAVQVPPDAVVIMRETNVTEEFRASLLK